MLAVSDGSGGRSLLARDRPPPLRARTHPEDPDELEEGFLGCGACGAWYPLLSGVAILAPRPAEYVARYREAIRRDVQRHGRLSPEGAAWLGRAGSRLVESADYGADFRFSQQFERPLDVARAMTDDLDAAYGPFADWLRAVDGRGPYDVLAGWARELVAERGLAVDAG